MEEYEKKLQIHSSILNEKISPILEEEDKNSLDLQIKNMGLLTVEITSKKFKKIDQRQKQLTKTNELNPKYKSAINHQSFNNKFPEIQKKL